MGRPRCSIPPPAAKRRPRQELDRLRQHLDAARSTATATPSSTTSAHGDLELHEHLHRRRADLEHADRDRPATTRASAASRSSSRTAPSSCRSRASNGKIAAFRSTDGGASWSKARHDLGDPLPRRRAATCARARCPPPRSTAPGRSTSPGRTAASAPSCASNDIVFSTSSDGVELERRRRASRSTR